MQDTQKSNHYQIISNQISLVKTKYPYIKNVRLNLLGKSLLIGTLDLAGEGTFICSRNEVYHLFRKSNSLGLNYRLLTDKSIPFKWINIRYTSKDRTSNLITSRDYFLHNGQTLNFNKKGFELQCFLPIELFGLDKAKNFQQKELSSASLRVIVEPTFFDNVL